MDKKQRQVLTGQARKMAYDVYSFIQNETKDIAFNLTEVKDGISQFTSSLFEKLDKLIDSMHKNNIRKSDCIGLHILNSIVSQIKIETAEAINIRVDLLANTLNHLKKVQQRTADATKVSSKTLRRIVIEANNPDFIGEFKTPGTKHSVKKPVTHLDSHAEVTIKNRFNYALQSNKEDLTIEKVRTIIKEENNFQGSNQSLYRIIKRMGYEMKRSKNNQGALVESQRLCSLRIKYLQNIIRYQREARPIVYMDHLYSEPHPNAKDNKSGSALVREPNRVVCAASMKGMVPHSLLTFNCALKVNANDNKNIQIYEKWCQMQLLPNIPPESVVIVDYSLYHEDDLFCPWASTKAEMQVWLTRKNIDFDKSFSVTQLGDLIKVYMENLFSIDRLLLEKGHDVVHLPKYLAELNPLKMAFYELKQRMDDTSKNDFKNLIEGNMSLLEGQQWGEMWCAVKRRENDYAKRHNIVIDYQKGGTPRTYQIFIETEHANGNVKCELIREDDNEVMSLSDIENSNQSDMEIENVFRMDETNISHP